MVEAISRLLLGHVLVVFLVMLHTLAMVVYSLLGCNVLSIEWRVDIILVTLVLVLTDSTG